MVNRSSRIVFVDPEDDFAPYWWPALIVLKEEFEMFRETMDSDISTIASNERLVCYFEDASFSVVPSGAMVPFAPDKEPYISYFKNIKRFNEDLGVERAVKFYKNGTIPEGFKWLRSIDRGRVNNIEPPLVAKTQKRVFTTSTTTNKRTTCLNKKPTTKKLEKALKSDHHHHHHQVETRSLVIINNFNQNNNIANCVEIPTFVEVKKFDLLKNLLPRSALLARL